MQKIVIVAGVVAFYFWYVSHKSLLESYKNLRFDTREILAVTSTLKDKLDMKDREIEDKKYALQKYNMNFEAFNGTDCARCHLETKHQFPYENKPLNLDDYIRVVREGIEGVMPSYINSPKKGIRDITDSELRRQFKILKTLERGSYEQ